MLIVTIVAATTATSAVGYASALAAFELIVPSPRKLWRQSPGTPLKPRSNPPINRRRPMKDRSADQGMSDHRRDFTDSYPDYKFFATQLRTARRRFDEVA